MLLQPHHTRMPDGLEIARQINPGILIPVHGEQPYFYRDRLGNSGINVVLPTVGEAIEV